MIGKPKLGHYRTRQDYYNLIASYPEETRARLLALKEGRFAWFQVDEPADVEAWLTEENHRVLEAGAEMGGEAGQIYQEYTEDQNAEILRLGFTVAEVDALIAGEVTNA